MKKSARFDFAKRFLLPLCGLLLVLASLPLRGGDPPAGLFAGAIYLRDPPPVAIARAGAGIHHSLAPFWSRPIVPFNRPLARFTYELSGAPEAMTLSDRGVLTWHPTIDDVGNLASPTVTVMASWDDFDPVCQSFTFAIEVVDYFPKLAKRTEPVFRFEGQSLGGSGVILEGSGDYRELLRWSLIDPPLGLSIDDEGFLRWDTGAGTGTPDPIPVRVRAEYETATEVLSSEVILTYYLLGTRPERNWSTFRAPKSSQKEGALMGWDLEQAGGWVIASQPFERNYSESGSIRFWKKNEAGRWLHAGILQPHIQQNHQMYGASVALSLGSDWERLAVGAPGLNGPQSSRNGGIYLYQRNPSNLTTDFWIPKGLITIPDSSNDLQLGASIDLNHETLIASAHGHRGKSNDLDSGAFYIFNREPSDDWTLSQEIINPDPNPAADLFGYPCALEESWIAVAATQDDEMGENAGAVYLYLQEASGWIQKQKLSSPTAEPNDRFGSRLCLSGEWLFIGTPHADSDQGKVEVFRLIDETWHWQQTLTEFLADDPQFFGAAIDHKGDSLVISSPGGFSFTVEDELTGNSAATISVFRLEQDLWTLDRLADESLGHHGSPSWGHDVSLTSEDAIVASHPNYPANNEGNPLPLTGRIFEYSWSNVVDNWETYRSSLLPGIEDKPTAGGDFDGNGISNLTEWVWGLNPISSNDNFGNFDPRFYRPFLDLKERSRPRLIIPVIYQTSGIKFQIFSSPDLKSWQEEKSLQWAPRETFYFPTGDGLRNGASLQPIILTPTEPSSRKFYRVELSSE